MSLYLAHCRAVLRFYRYTFMGAEQHRQNITFPDWDVTSEREKIEVVSQSESFVTINGTRQPAENYLAQTSSSALKIPVSIQKTPTSVQVITHAVIQDRGALSINQAIETVSGVERNLTFPNSLTFRVRGFVDASTTLRDGFREQTGTQDIQGVDNIEVLKGPASVLYGGSTSSGGTVNVEGSKNPWF